MTPGSIPTAPSRHFARVGALVLMCVMAACDRVASGGDEGPRVLELTNDTIQLGSGVSLIDVKVGRAADTEFDPPAVQARQSDVVRFTAQDHAGHALAFEAQSLQGDALAYLERTGQLRSPPLIASGSAWVITLEGAPPGEYPFRCATHAAAGRLTVTAH